MARITLTKQQKTFLDYLNKDNFIRTYFERFYVEGRDDGNLYIVCTYTNKGREIIDGSYKGCGVLHKLPATLEDFVGEYKSLIAWATDSATYNFTIKMGRKLI